MNLDLEAVALCAARLMPVSLLCPLLGGWLLPAPVRLSAVLAFACWLHFGAGVGPAGPSTDGVELGGRVTAELCTGLAIGLVSMLPFESARIGGALGDLFRGSSAEAALPGIGTREAASGELLHRLAIAQAFGGPALGLWLSALARSFAFAPPGGFGWTDSLALAVAAQLDAALRTGLTLAAPLAVLCLLVDGLLALLTRAAGSLRLHELGPPAKLLGGVAALWAGAEVSARRLGEELERVGSSLIDLLEMAR